MTTLEQTQKALADLKHQHKTNWLAFNEKLNAILLQVGARNTEKNIADDVTAESIIAAGFTPAEADAIMFVFTEDCMGQPVVNLEMVERWFCYCA